MRVPMMTAECAIGPARGTYAATPGSVGGRGIVPAAALVQALPGERAQIEGGLLPNPCGDDIPCWGDGPSADYYRCCGSAAECHIGLGRLPYCQSVPAATGAS